MWLKHLSLQNFRNYQQLAVDFHSGLNIFLGQNAQGKTNILESIYFLSLTRSHRTHSDKDLIGFGQKTLSVSGVLQRATTSLPLDINLTEKGRITKVNHLKQERLSDYIGHMNVVLFAPEDLQLIKGAPALRRKFMDMELGQIKPTYLSELSHYHHVLKQRNTYLKTAATIDQTFLSVLDEQLADYGSRVIAHRMDFLSQLEDFTQKKHFYISDSREEIALHYRSSINFTERDSFVDNYLTALQRCRQRDIFKKNTGVGPHRDDMEAFINDVPAHFGSQGQQRSLVLSLKLAEIELMHQVTKEYPILLLDDVMSELDNTRQTKLLETISDTIQTFITTTSLDHLHQLPEDLNIYRVKQGVIEVDNNVN